MNLQPRIKVWNTKNNKFELTCAVCPKLIDVFPLFTIAKQSNPLGYRGMHNFIEIGWLIFHAKLIIWKKK